MSLLRLCADTKKLPIAVMQTAGFLCMATAQAQPACYHSSVLAPAPLLGNHGEIVRLADGSLWEVVGEYQYLYEYYPSIVACPSLGKLILGRHSINARPIRPAVSAPPANSGPTSPQGAQNAKPPAPQAADLIESQIDGEFTGWDGETVFRLMNGQIWQQVSYSYTYHYAFMPRVLIFRAGSGYQMQVEGVEGRIAVRQLR